MIFSSLLFLFRFLPVMIMAYYAVPSRFRNGILFIGSLVFYGWGEPVYMGLLLFSTAVDFIHGKLTEHYKIQGRLKMAKLIVASSVIINVSLLCFFKYADFLIGTVNQMFHAEFPLLALPLPMGISFYTFQTMSYTIDVYRGRAKAQKDIVAFGAYVALFPQLIAGPIVQYHTIEAKLKERKESFGQFALGIRFFVIGLGKKILLANHMGALWNQILSMTENERSVLLVWFGIFSFGMQIYFDFSGYSDMAVGLGNMLGFHFPENFHYPYESKSITEFWRRWHISLGTWFKEYVYIPLGGNQKGKVSQIRNILIVWLLTGIWHGAGWNFLFWGAYFGFLLMIEKFFLGAYLLKLPRFIQQTYAMLFVFFGWTLFAFEDIRAGINYMKQMFFMGGLNWINRSFVYLLYTNLVMVVIAVLGSTKIPAKVGNCFLKRYRSGTWLEIAFILFLLTACTAFLVNDSYNPFLYFRF